MSEGHQDFLLYGTQPRRTEDVCLNESKEIRFKDVDLPEDPAPSAARLMDAGTAGPADNPGLQLFRVPGEPIAVTDNDFPVDLTAQGDGARLAVTPLSGQTRGAPVYYGPIDGELTVKSGPGGSLAVLDDGAPVMPRTTAEAGDPVVPSDPGGGAGPGPDPDPGPGGTGNPPPDTSTPPDTQLPDTDAPETTIRKKPKRSVTTKAKSAMARFSFTADEPGVTFQCKLDRGAFKRCSAALKVKAKPGKHKLLVRAVDAAGNADPTPATWTWKVKKKR